MPDHEGPVLLHVEAVLFFGCMLFDEVEQVQVALCVLLGPLVLPKLKVADSPVVVLQRLHLERHTVLGAHPEVLALLFGRVCLGLVVMEERLVTVRLLAVRATFCLHLEDTHFNAKLDLLPVVVAADSANAELL